MNDTILFVISVLGFVFSCGSGAIWYLEYYAKRENKKYAAEREFGHIKNSLLQLTTNLDNQYQDIERKLDDIKDDIKEIIFNRKFD